MEKIRIDMTSAAFLNADDPGKLLQSCREATGDQAEFGVQLHNYSSENETGFFISRTVPLSAHAPLYQSTEWNFATSKPGRLWEQIAENVQLYQKLGIDRVVFHGFFMTDFPISAFGHGKTQAECLGDAFRPELCRWQGNPRNRDFTGLPEYLERLELLKNNLQKLKKFFPEIKFHIENDFPTFGRGLMLAEYAQKLDFPLCLDTSHLWTSCKLLGRDFLSEVEKMCANGKVQMMHLHASKFTDDTPPEMWGDGHLSLDTPNLMQLDKVVQTAYRQGLRHYVLETKHGSAKDIKILLDWLKRA